jgi:hypothetical protein
LPVLHLREPLAAALRFPGGTSVPPPSFSRFDVEKGNIVGPVLSPVEEQKVYCPLSPNLGKEGRRCEK